MTATPKLFSSEQKKHVGESVELCSMDDESIYGEEIYSINFGDALKEGLLSDYRVIVLTIPEKINENLKEIYEELKKKDKSIQLSDVAKLAGCINALSKNFSGMENLKIEDPKCMKRGVAFCQNIDASKVIEWAFNSITKEHFDKLDPDVRGGTIGVECRQIDGTNSASVRDEKMTWLKEGDENRCRLITNVRCLSEGVDVPSLDAVLFLAAKNSQVDIVQAVGRVMRKAQGKTYGYIIIPVIVNPDADVDETIKSSNFKTIWQV